MSVPNNGEPCIYAPWIDKMIVLLALVNMFSVNLIAIQIVALFELI